LDLDALLDDAVAGSRPFKEHLAREQRLESASREVPVAHRLLDRPPLNVILNPRRSKPERDSRIRAAVLTHGYTQAAVAKELRLARNTVSRIIRTTPDQSLFSGAMVQRET
jgi:DNA-binding NarL/FixJ family response regulator